MKYYNKIEWILEHDDFMERSSSIVDKEAQYIEKSGKPVPSKVAWRMVNVNITKKLKNIDYAGGICGCTSGLLCVHRKKYLIDAINGKPTNNIKKQKSKSKGIKHEK